MPTEGLEQAGTIDQCFSGITTFNRISHAATAKLVAFAIEAASHVAMLFKAFHNRPRPTQLSPTLMPPIDPPEHGAFPSVHATQTWTTALLPNVAMGERLEPQPISGVVFGDAGERQNPLFNMARGIARNRKIMGLHDPSDSEAGRRLAHAICTTVIRQSSGRIRDLMNAAHSECGEAPMTPPATDWPT